MDNGVAPRRRAEHQRLVDAQRALGQENWLRTLRDLDKDAAPDATVARLPYSSSWLFTTGKDTRWAVDPVPAPDDGGGGDASRVAEALRDFDFIIISHLHADHFDPAFLNRVVGGRARWIVPARVADAFRQGVAAAPERITVLPQGANTEVKGLRIVCGPGLHDEPGMPPVPGGCFAVHSPDGVRLAFPGDVRDYGAQPPEMLMDADYLFGHLWLGRRLAHGDDFPPLEGLCRFLLACRPARIVLGHLLETSRDVDSMWTFRHAGLVRERLRELSPATPVLVPRHGDTFALGREPTPDPYADWNSSRRDEFNAWLGCAIKNDVPGQIDRAAAEAVPALELNQHTLSDLDHAALRRKLDAWRQAGGRLLSLHLNAVPIRAASTEDWSREALAWCDELGCDRVTEHVPACSVAYMRENREAAAERFVRALSPLAQRGVAVGIENTHMSEGTPADDRRGYGFVIEEWLEIIGLSRRRGGELFGAHVDVGHAYTNYPFHCENTLETWLRAGGPLINGVHLHQYERDRDEADRYPKGHFHIAGRTGGHPSLEPLYRLWGEGVFRAPMFLEISRGPEAEPFASLKRLR